MRFFEEIMLEIYGKVGNFKKNYRLKSVERREGSKDTLSTERKSSS